MINELVTGEASVKIAGVLCDKSAKNLEAHWQSFRKVCETTAKAEVADSDQEAGKIFHNLDKFLPAIIDVRKNLEKLAERNSNYSRLMSEGQADQSPYFKGILATVTALENILSAKLGKTFNIEPSTANESYQLWNRIRLTADRVDDRQIPFDGVAAAVVLAMVEILDKGASNRPV